MLRAGDKGLCRWAPGTSGQRAGRARVHRARWVLRAPGFPILSEPLQLFYDWKRLLLLPWWIPGSLSRDRVTAGCSLGEGEGEGRGTAPAPAPLPASRRPAAPPEDGQMVTSRRKLLTGARSEASNTPALWVLYVGGALGLGKGRQGWGGLLPQGEAMLNQHPP